MKFEKEIQQQKFRSSKQKATLNLLFTCSWLGNRHKEFFKDFGLTPQQYNVLRILRGQNPESISTSDIKARMLDKSSDASRIVDRLTLKGWVTKKVSHADRRLVDVNISDDGLNLLQRMDSQMDVLDDTICLTDKEADQLSELLDKVRE